MGVYWCIGGVLVYGGCISDWGGGINVWGVGLPFIANSSCSQYCGVITPFSMDWYRPFLNS